MYSPIVCEDFIRQDVLLLFRTSVFLLDKMFCYCLGLQYCIVMYLVCHGCNTIKCRALREAVFVPLDNISSSLKNVHRAKVELGSIGMVSSNGLSGVVQPSCLEASNIFPSLLFIAHSVYCTFSPKWFQSHELQ